MAGHQPGGMFQFGQVPTYVVEPRDRATFGGNTLLLIPDMTGVANPQNRELADRYASEGNFLTVMPDLFPGLAVPPSVLDGHAADAGVGAGAGKVGTAADRFQANLCCMSPEAVVTHRLASQWSRFEANHPAQRKLGFLVLIIAELEERHGATKIACCGYGWGSSCVLPLALVGGIDAWAVVHAPAYVLSPLWDARRGENITVPGIIQDNLQEILITTLQAQCSDHDLDMPEGVRRALMDRAAKTPRHGLEVNLYPNTYYGFAVRGDRRGQDERDRYIATAKELVIQSTLAFFENHLSRTTTGAEAVPLTDQQRIGALEAVVANMPRPPRL